MILLWIPFLKDLILFAKEWTIIFFEGEVWAISKKIPAQQKRLEKNGGRTMWGKGGGIKQVLTSSCPPKKYLAQPKGGKKFPCPRN